MQSGTQDLEHHAKAYTHEVLVRNLTSRSAGDPKSFNKAALNGEDGGAYVGEWNTPEVVVHSLALLLN